MRQKQNYFMLTLLVSMLFVPLGMNAEGTVTEVLQPQFGKQTVTVKSGQELTFYDFKGTGSISSTGSNNSLSMTVFKPEEAGMAIQITFESCDVKNDNSSYSSSYPGQVNVYNGVVDADSSYTWPTSRSDFSASTELPTGELIETLDGDYTNKVFYSTSSDGALSVLMFWIYAKKCEGWTAKVKCVKLTDMTVTGAGSEYDNVTASPTSKTFINLGSAYVTATGVLNADTLTSVSFKMTKNNGVINPLTLMLYEGSTQRFNDATPLETIISESDGIYTLSLRKAITEGKNYFSIAGNILSTAEVGAEAQLEIIGVTTNVYQSGVTPFTAGTPVTVTNPAIVIMTTDDQTVTVSDQPLSFYDDGGIDGQITSKSKCQVTFVPATSGKKVMVNFSSVKLFEGSIYSQYLRVYNGTEVKAANLLKEVKSGTTARVRSTSGDGALTVVLDASEVSYTADGFEALVEQFTPQTMTVDSISASQVTDGTVCAGDENQAILSVNVCTENTEPALVTKKFSFTTNGTDAQIAKAALYYTKASNTFATTTKVGETDVIADAFEITSSDEIALSEGDNYFWLAYTIRDSAANGQKVDAAIISATLGETTITVENGSPEGDRTVENTVYSYADQGTVTKTINGSMTFKTKQKSEYSEYYEGGTDERINTFVPMHEGMVCQIDFSSFNLAYSSSSYGVKAKFKIYNGQGTTGDVLWELSNSDDSSAGPGKVIRSTATDGSLTVVFCPNNSSNYSYKGFTATVSEYKQQPMTVQSVSASQPTTSDASIGAANQDILSMNINTAGSLDTKALNSVNINLKGSQASITGVSIYSTTSADAAVAADATALATATVDGTTEDVTLSLTSPLTLVEGDNWLRIRYDISTDATVDATIDAAITGVNISGTDVAVTEGDPDGSRTLKNIYIIQSGDNGEVTVTSGSNIMFYDDGGAEGDASINFSGTVTFAPKTEGEIIVFNFNSWNAKSGTTIYLYSGDSIKTTADASYTSYGDTPVSFSSASEDGKVTVKYATGSKYNISEGFAIEVVARQAMALHPTSVTATAVAPAQVLKGQSDVCMARIDMKVEGDNGALDITRLAFSGADASTVSEVKVYSTGIGTTFAPLNLMGAASADKTEVEGSYKITKTGTYVLWVAYDIATTAAEGSAANLTITSLTGSGVDYAIDSECTASTTVKKGASGTYTVGAGADYGTIQAAVDAISGGIDGPVVINVKRGVYNETVNIPDIPGTSEANTITLQSESGNYNDVKLYYDTYNKPSGTDSYSSAYGVFTINGADYFTLRGIEITTTDLTFRSVVHIKNESRHVTVDSCYLHTETIPSYTTGKDINLIYTYTIDKDDDGNYLYNTNNDYLTIKNCLIEGGWIGIAMHGTTIVNPNLPKQRGGTIANNILREQGSKAIYIQDELGAKIKGNRIENTLSEYSGFLGIDCQLRDATYSESCVIENNSINITPKNNGIGISMRNMYGSETAPVIIANNEITVNGVSASCAGMKVGYPCEYMNIVNNTVRTIGTAVSAPLWFNDTMTGNVNVMNNILQNETSESKSYAYRFYKATSYTGITFSNNILYTAGSIFAGYNSGSLSATFEEWNTLAGETDSYNEQVTFLSDDILEPAAEGNLRNGKPLSYVTTDITGTKRDTAKPTIGAYEYSEDTTAPAMLEGYPTVTSITDSTAVLNISPNQSVTAYVVVKDAEASAPTADDVLASTLTTAVRKNTVGNVTMTGLVKDSVYIAYTVLKSLRNTVSDVIPSEKFTATSEPIIIIPNVYVKAQNDTVAAGQTAELKATITEGTAPYTVSWTNGKLNAVGTASAEKASTVSLSCTPAECDLYYVTVTDANGKTASDTCRVIVTGEAVTATFENLYLGKDSYWCGPDTKGESVQGAWAVNTVGSFVSGSYQFGNTYTPAYGSWTGFAYSNSTASTFTTLADQYNAATAGGYDGSENFAVAYSGGTIGVLNSADGDSIRGCYITNNAYALNSIVNGDSYSKKFAEGDYLKIVFTGTRADGTTASLDYYLADYRAEKEADRYYLDTWQWADLRQLGKVTSVTFALDGSDTGSWGLNTPAYFCLDNFNGERVIKDTETRGTDEEVELSKLFTFDDAEATVTYAIADPLTADETQDVTLTSDGRLTAKSTMTLVVSATQKGKIQFVRIPFDKSLGITRTENAVKENEAARYTIDGQRIGSPRRGVNIIRTTDGKTYKVAVK